MILRQIYKIDEVAELAQEISEKMGEKNIYLSGELGAGKTYLTKQILKHKGVKEKTVKSPTFNIKRTYTVADNTYHHVDLYRLDTFDIAEIMSDDRGIYIIEWADKLSNHEKPDGLSIHIEINKDGSRTFKIANL